MVPNNDGSFQGGRENYGGPHFGYIAEIGGHDSLALGNNNARKIVVAKGAGKLLRGTILGLIVGGADDGKFTVSKLAATDGSQEPDKVLCYNIDATDDDVQAVAYYEGSFDVTKLVFGQGHTPKTIDKPFRFRDMILENPMG